jgi:type I restriction enzyme, S subunit
MASDGWVRMPFGDFVTLQRGHDLPDERRRPGNVPILGSFGITGWHDEPKTSGPGVTVGRSGASFGVATYSPVNFWPLNTALYVVDFHGNDERFAYYFLKCFDFKGYNSGSAQPSLNRNFIHPVRVDVPPPSEQRAIARILGTLDDKIELNRQMSETLEAIAQALFKSWFVDFDPIRAKAEGRDPCFRESPSDLFPDCFEDSELGEIPAGWTVRSLDEIAKFLNGLALQKYPAGDGGWLPAIKIAQLRRGDALGADRVSADLPADYIVRDGDVLFSWSGSLECQLWTGGKGALNQHLFKVTSEDYPKWLFYYWTLHHLSDFRQIAAGKATTMGHIQRHHLTNAKVVLPSSQVLAAADRIFSPMLGQIVQRRIEARTLTEVRDLLLPKLISGELRVRDAERAVAEAAA